MIIIVILGILLVPYIILELINRDIARQAKRRALIISIHEDWRKERAAQIISQRQIDAAHWYRINQQTPY